jgi:hypothetical protein
MIYLIFLFFAQVITAANTVVYIVRHADDGSDGHLTSRGQQQAKHIKNFFSGSPFPKPDKLVATDVARCRETLWPISRRLPGLPINKCSTDLPTTQSCFKSKVITGKTHLYALRSAEMQNFVTILGATVTAGCPNPVLSFDQVWKVSWSLTGAKTFECHTMIFPS